MKIALYHNLTSGGSKREAFEFARRSTASGWQVAAYSPSTANDEFLPLHGVIQELFSYRLNLLQPIQASLPGLRKYVDFFRLRTNLKRINRTSRQIAGDIDNRNYDFAFLHHDQIVQSPFISQYLKTPSCYYCAEPMRQFYEPPIERPYAQSKTKLDAIQAKWYAPVVKASSNLVKNLDRRNIQHAGVLLTNSFFSAEAIYRAYGLRARVVYLGVDQVRFRPMNLERARFVLSVGAISPLKGFDFIIRSLGELPQSQRPGLVIVGNTASQGETQFLSRLAHTIGVDLKIYVNIPDEALSELYNRAAAFVYSPVMEPFGLAPVEAMACSTPVVAVKEGGVRESVQDGETGYLVERIPSLFAEKLTWLLDHPQTTLQLGQNGRQEIERFWTWDHAFERFRTVIEETGLAKV
jgi:glycosyltransferase involved in cell wall biosynthesis